jgi:hypothetical protein
MNSPHVPVSNNSVPTSFDSFLCRHSAMANGRRGQEYRDLARHYFDTYQPSTYVEEMHIGEMVFARLMIRRFVDLEARLAAAGRTASFQAERLKHHKRYTKSRKTLEKLQRARRG